MRRSDTPTRQTIETVWRIEAARLIGGLVRFVRSVDRAEDLAQDALLSALESWPETGIPDNPGAWLMTTAKHRAVDEGRRTAMMDAKHSELENAARVVDESRRGIARRARCRRCSATDAYRLSSRVVQGRARRVDAAVDSRAVDRRDCARLSRFGSDDGTTNCPREADAVGGQGTVRNPCWR